MPNMAKRIALIRFSIGRVIIVDKINVKIRNSMPPTIPETITAVRKIEMPSAAYFTGVRIMIRQPVASDFFCTAI
ncbi:hypothetical protein D3C84_1221700 [compost metagenome]